MSRRAIAPSLPTRLAASATALLVMTLAVFAASPTLHAWLHGHPAEPHAAKSSAAHAGCTHSHEAPVSDPHGDDELCVVTQFSHGKADCAHAPVLTPVAMRPVTAILSAARPLTPRTPAVFLPPGCGPPAV